MLDKLKKRMQELANDEKAKQLMRYFKTGKGEYGEGDIFLGLIVPEQRKIARNFSELSLEDIQELLSSKIHEHRMIALFILVERYRKSKKEEQRKEIFEFYLKNTKNINNWDLVDLSAPKIIGAYLFDKNRKILYELAKSNHLWEKRIAILSTFFFISKNDFDDALKIAELLVNDKHDLIHKAVGWMLREIGKRNQEAEEDFLRKYYKTMPRTMLRYAIEKFDEKKRKSWLNIRDK